MGVVSPAVVVVSEDSVVISSGLAVVSRLSSVVVNTVLVISNWCYIVFNCISKFDLIEKFYFLVVPGSIVVAFVVVGSTASVVGSVGTSFSVVWVSTVVVSSSIDSQMKRM